jgi:hypothetical protein
MARAQKRSLYGRSLCSVLLYQSVVPPSVFVHHFTRSLPSFGSFPLFFYFFDWLPSVALFYRKKNNSTLSVLAGAYKIKIKTDFFLFGSLRLPFFICGFAVSRSQLLRAVVPLVALASVVFILTATPPPVRFFIPLRLHYGHSLGG